MKLVSLFSGIGAFEKALTNLKVDYELLAYCEIDKYASKAYSLIHGVDESLNLGDITKIDLRDILEPVDLITYGFPCQDISVAGNQKGLFNEDGSKTRSGLFFDALKVIEDTKPKIAIAENVKNLVGKRFKKEFEVVLQSLEKAGYNNYWKVLNAKDYGIPQNRERVFIVSIRKDIDPYSNTIEGFPWPLPFDNVLRLKDLLEYEVDEKFYITDEKVEKLIGRIKNGVKGTYPNGEYQVSSALSSMEHRGQGWKENTGALLARDYKDPKVVAVPCLTPERVKKRQNGRRFKTDGEPMFTLTSQDKHGVLVIDDTQGFDGTRTYNNESPCLRSQRSGIKVLVKPNEINQIGNIFETDSFGGNPQTGRVYGEDGISPTLNTCGGGQREPKVLTKYRIRKLTPKECFRLMGFTDKDIDILIENGISNTQLYKQAGNSIVVDVAEEILCQLLDENNEICV